MSPPRVDNFRACGQPLIEQAAPVRFARWLWKTFRSEDGH